MNDQWLILAVLVGCAACTDLKNRTIPNALSAAGAAAGVIAGWFHNGFAGLAASAAGFAVGFGLMLALHLAGALGAGDVKLFGAIGAVGGAGITFSIAVHSILFAGLIGIIILSCKGLLKERGQDILFRIFRLICFKDPDGLVTYWTKKDMLRFPFLLAVLPGFAAACWESLG